MNYTDTFGGHHFAENYLYVFFDFGTLAPFRQGEIKEYIQGYLQEKDCIGSINTFRNFLNGVLLLNKKYYQEMRDLILQMSEALVFDEIKNEADITYKVHDKWGRPNTFILFD